MAETILFGQYCPDVTDLGTDISVLISGVFPRVDGYGPVPSLSELTAALPSACRGYYFARRTDGTVAVFAATSTKLYLLNNTTYEWADVSQGLGTYAALVAGDNWQFRQFNDLVIAVQANVAPQKFTLSSSSEFADLGGTPPQASHIAIINRFVVLSGLFSDPQRVQWSDLDAPETWTAGTGLSDYQDIPDGGIVHVCSGGDAFGVIFQDESVRRLTYAPGSAVTFQIDRLSSQDTLFGQYSVIETGSRTFYSSAQGFKVIEPGGVPRPIGKDRVDTTFFTDVDTSNLQLLQGAADPKGTRVFWAYKSLSGQIGQWDKILCYDYALDRWSLLPMSGEYLAYLARPGITLEGMDVFAPTQLLVTGAADNGAGLVRLELTATSNADFDIAGQNFIVVQGVVGTTEANGTWVVNIIDATHIDLVGSTFANPWTSGGAIGGSLDALTVSLDEVSNAALSALSMVSGNHRAGFLTGDYIEAILETAQADLQGRLVFVSSVCPLTDSPDAYVSIGGRMRAQAAIAYTSESLVNAEGDCPLRIETRYAKGRLRIAAASDWTFARGLQPTVNLAGDR
jgi:hypothetical protein